MSLSAYLLSPCADGGQVTSHPRAVAFTLSPRLVVIKRKIAVGPEGSPAHRTGLKDGGRERGGREKENRLELNRIY